MFTAPPLDPDAIAERLPPLGPVPWRVQVYLETSSTNDVIRALGQSGAPEGAAVFAETQTMGRGQHGRAWHSAPGLGLWFSILLRPAPELPPKLWSRLTPTIAVALTEAVDLLTGRKCMIKWPNDLYLDDRKLAGILTESIIDSAKPASSFAVAGIGLNVNHLPADWPAEIREQSTSLRLAAGRAEPIDRNEAAAALLNSLAAQYAALKNGSPSFFRETIIPIYRQRDWLLGKEISLITAHEQKKNGTADGIDEEGKLRFKPIPSTDEILSIESGTVSTKH